MARGRMLSKSLSTSEKRARLHDVAGPLAEFAMGLYDLLIAHADDFGREAGDLFTVKYRIDPASPRPLHEFAEALWALDHVGLITWYTAEVEGQPRQCIEIRNFDRFQWLNNKRTKSLFPPPQSGKFPEVPGSSGNLPGVPVQEKGREGKVREGKGTEEKGRELDRGVRATALQTVPTETDSAVPQTAREKHPKAETRTAAENLDVITTVVLRDILPLGLPDSEYTEATKSRCATLRITYDSDVVRKAIDSALHIHAHHGAGS